MQVFVATDLEGVGRVLIDEHVSGDSPEFARARHLLTQEVNAAVDGATKPSPMLCDSWKSTVV
jgi:D-amino peptidase